MVGESGCCQVAFRERKIVCTSVCICVRVCVSEHTYQVGSTGCYLSDSWLLYVVGVDKMAPVHDKGNIPLVL